MTQEWTPRQIELVHPDSVPRWYFNRSIDLECWLPAITTHPGEGQDNDGALVCAFSKEHQPALRHGLLMAASHEMFRLLEATLPMLRKSVVEEENLELRLLCDQVAERIAEIKAVPVDPVISPAW